MNAKQQYQTILLSKKHRQWILNNLSFNAKSKFTKITKQTICMDIHIHYFSKYVIIIT